MGASWHPYFFGDVNMNLFDSIKDANRDEIIAIPFYGWVKNPVESMIRYLMSTGKFSKWLSKYPDLNLFPITDQNRLFSLSSQYTINSFRRLLIESGKRNGINENQADADFNEMLMNADPRRCVATLMELVVAKLLNEPFVKYIYIYEPVMSDAIKRYLADVYTENTERIILLESNIKAIIESSKPKFTTIYVEDTDQFMDVLQSYTKEEREKYMTTTYYILPAKSSLTDKAKQLSASMGVLPTGEDPYRYQGFIKGTLAETKSTADFMQLKYIGYNEPKNSKTEEKK